MTGPSLALTLDNGPDPIAKPGASALLDKVAHAGHAIGNHTYSQPRSFGSLRAEAAIDEIERKEVLLARHQSPLRLFRPSAGGGIKHLPRFLDQATLTGIDITPDLPPQKMPVQHSQVKAPVDWLISDI